MTSRKRLAVAARSVSPATLLHLAPFFFVALLLGCFFGGGTSTTSGSGSGGGAFFFCGANAAAAAFTAPPPPPAASGAGASASCYRLLRRLATFSSRRPRGGGRSACTAAGGGSDAAEDGGGVNGGFAYDPPNGGSSEGAAATRSRRPRTVGVGAVGGPGGLPGRDEQLERLQRRGDEAKAFDVLVIGGGATGAGIALDAASRGLDVACLERGDFSSETSSRSSKLIWAGIRYVGTALASLLSFENLLKEPFGTVEKFADEMAMVLHCHRERRYMTSTQRHLCHWMPIAVPFSEWYSDPPPMGHPLFSLFPVLAPLVFKLYDGLSAFTCPPSYVISKDEAMKKFPHLDGRDLKYCAVFYESMHNDARTNIAIALSAAEAGAAIANYVSAVDLIKDDSTGRVSGAIAEDRVTGRRWPIRAKKVVLAGGPFTDELRKMEVNGDGVEDVPPAVQTAAGTHVVLPGRFLPKDLGLLDPNTSDGRFLFVLPWLGHTLVGTTDRKSDASTLPEPPEEDVDWILREFSKHLAPDACVRRSDVLSAWTGWRPLAADPYAPPGSHTSRDHVISENEKSGVIFVAGGKWTTWRQMAEEVTDRLVGPDGPRCRTLDIKLHGGEGHSDDIPLQLVEKYGIDDDVADHLASTYGSRAREVCELVRTMPAVAGERIAHGFPYIFAEVTYACMEYARTVEDVLSRRTRLAFLNKEAAIGAITKVADVMGEELMWTEQEKTAQMKSARLYLESYGGRNPIKADKLLREASRESPGKLFAVLDRDRNGYIDVHELSEAVSILGLSFSDMQVEGAFREMDADGLGRANFKAFERWWNGFTKSPLYEQMLQEIRQKDVAVRTP